MGARDLLFKIEEEISWQSTKKMLQYLASELDINPYSLQNIYYGASDRYGWPLESRLLELSQEIKKLDIPESYLAPAEKDFPLLVQELARLKQLSIDKTLRYLKRYFGPGTNNKLKEFYRGKLKAKKKYCSKLEQIIDWQSRAVNPLDYWFKAIKNLCGFDSPQLYQFLQECSGFPLPKLRQLYSEVKKEGFAKKGLRTRSGEIWASILDKAIPLYDLHETYRKNSLLRTCHGLGKVITKLPKNKILVRLSHPELKEMEFVEGYPKE